MRVFALVVIACMLAGALSQQKTKKKTKANPNDNRGNTPFFLQDPTDQMCLGPNGFTVCDERALWILTRRAGKKTYSLVSLLNPSPYGMCLEKKNGWFFGLFGSSDKVGMGLCSQSGSKNWDFEFIDQKHVKLSSKGQCVVRGKKTYKNSVSSQTCKKGEFTPLLYHPTAVHENGFHLKSADGGCFDGSKFRACEGQDSNSLLWGVGIKYVRGKANRYFFNFNVNERSQCLVASGSKISKDKCSNAGALKWGLTQDGQLSQNNGKMCLARLQDNKGVMARCGEANEYVSMDVPTVYSAEDLEEMLKNPGKMSPEEKSAVEQMAKQYSLQK